MITDRRVAPEALGRFLDPKTVAIVGASDRSDRYALQALTGSPIDVYMVNPTVHTVLGRRAYGDLASLPRPVDAVYCLVNARRSVEVVEEAGVCGAGGVVVQAAGFSESGGDGADLERRLSAAAATARLPVLGPNCNGYVNVHSSAFLSGAPQLSAVPGSVGVISHSGGMLLDVASASVDRSIGFSKLISTGNEAVTDLVDYLDYLIEDPDTDVICLIVESIRRPAAFFAAVDRAVRQGKPVIALKLGRSTTARALAATHTGAVLGESWVYDAAFAQHGVVSARDIGDLLDRATVFVHIRPSRWTPVGNLAVITMSGGAAALCSDVCEQEGVDLPGMEAVRGAVTAHVPGASILNPVDLTGFARGRGDVLDEVVSAYVSAPGTDALLMIWSLAELSRDFGLSVAELFTRVAADADIPVLLADAGQTHVGSWASGCVDQGVGVVSGIRPAIRGLAAMRQFGLARQRCRRMRTRAGAPLRPDSSLFIPTATGHMLSFSATMQVLKGAGIPVVPYRVVPAHELPDAVAPAFEGRLVVKLADVPHRSDIGGVRVGVHAGDLPDAIRDLRSVAASQALSPEIVIQPTVGARAEIIVGADTSSELGPVVVCGLGGIFVELIRKFAARLTPLCDNDPAEMLRESGLEGIISGARGESAWDPAPVFTTILAVDDLIQAEWISSIDINPIMLTGSGPAAVDALITVEVPERVKD